MDITSFKYLKYNTIDEKWNLFVPSILYTNNNLSLYTVQSGEEMRIDLVVLSMYNDNYKALDDIDIILRINNIDNPLNIIEGMELYYPPDISSLDSYRILYDDNSNIGKSIRDVLSKPNKTTKKDNNRKDFLENNYSLPPVVLEQSKSPIRLENGEIKIGGIN